LHYTVILQLYCRNYFLSYSKAWQERQLSQTNRASAACAKTYRKSFR